MPNLAMHLIGISTRRCETLPKRFAVTLTQRSLLIASLAFEIAFVLIVLVTYLYVLYV